MTAHVVNDDRTCRYLLLTILYTKPRDFTSVLLMETNYWIVLFSVVNEKLAFWKILSQFSCYSPGPSQPKPTCRQEIRVVLIPPRIFIKVDFPAPFSPTNACTSPVHNSKRH